MKGTAPDPKKLFFGFSFIFLLAAMVLLSLFDYTAPQAVSHIALSQGATPTQQVLALTTIATQTPVTPTIEIATISITHTSQTGVSISWKTSIPTSGYITVGTTTTRLLQAHPLSKAIALTHAYTLSGLLPKTSYFFMIHAMDQENTSYTSNLETFTTL